MVSIVKTFRRSKLAPVAVYGLVLMVLATESMTQLGFAHALFYPPVIILAALTARTHHVYLTTALAIAFTFVGYGISPPAPEGFSPYYVWANRFASILSILAVAWLSILALRYQQKMAQQLVRLSRQESQLRRTTQLAKVSEWSYNPASNTVTLSKKAAELCDFKQTELPLATFANRFFGQGRLMLESMTKLQDTGAHHVVVEREVEAVLIRTNNDKRHLRILASMTPDGVVVGVMQDITAQKREALKMSQDMDVYRAITSAAPIILWYADTKGHVSAASDEIENTSGGAEAINNWLQLVHPDDRTATLNRWMRCVDQQKAFQAEYRLQHKDGLYYWHMATAKPQFDAKGNIERWVGATVNIEHLKNHDAVVE